MSTYTQEDSVLWPAPSNLPERVKSTLPLGTYSIGTDPQKGYFLQRQEDFQLPPKIYGSPVTQAERILTTFDRRARSTGVLLSGEKGSGKTLLATMLAVRARVQGISTLIVNAPFHGEDFNAFIQGIDEPCVVLFDEFEKTYHREEWQSALLTLLDGTAVTKKLFVLTMNEIVKTSRYLRNRPGRVFYALEYDTLDEAFVREYCEELLVNKEHIDGVATLVMMYERFNFDMLKALVEEMNRYGESAQSALTMLNIRPDWSMSTTYSASYTIGGVPHSATHTDVDSISGHPMQHPCFNVDFYNVEGDAYNPENKEHTRRNVLFTQYDLLRMDARKGVFVYAKEDVVMVLKKEPPALPLWRKLSAL